MLAPVSAQVLPGAEAEVRGISRVFRPATVLVGADASESRFRTLAPGYQILHLATFGVLNPQNPLLSYVRLRPGDEQDGRLEVHEVFELALRARLVVLSACETALGSGALGDLPAGDDWLGLVQAFLSAGSTRVLATVWPVADRPTASLMTDFYTPTRRSAPEDMALAEARAPRRSAGGARGPAASGRIRAHRRSWPAGAPRERRHRQGTLPHLSRSDAAIGGTRGPGAIASDGPGLLARTRRQRVNSGSITYAYAALPPGSVPGGAFAAVRNGVTGEVVDAVMVNGG